MVAGDDFWLAVVAEGGGVGGHIVELEAGGGEWQWQARCPDMK
jgi:hypothetical protein